MKLTVIVPTRDRIENLPGTLEALAAQTLDHNEYEVILSDDGSRDATYRLIEQYQFKFRFKYIFSNVPKPHSWNASIPRNFAALIADHTTMAYVFVDSDVMLPPHALQCYVEDLEMNKNRVIIGPYDFYAPGNNQIQVFDVRNKKFEEATIDKIYDTVHDGLACFGGNLVIPKDIFWSVGGFDEDVHIGLEDGSMGLKLWKKGAHFSYDNRTRGKHQWHKTPEDRFPTDMKSHIDQLNLKHFHTVNPDYGIIEASREAYASWGFPDWKPPESWLKNQLGFMMKI